MKHATSRLSSIRRAILLLALFILIPLALQAGIYPDEIYSGVNPIGISEPAGIASIQINIGRGWQTLRSGVGNNFFRVSKGASFSRCAKKASFVLFVERIDLNLAIRIRVNKCGGGSQTYTMSLENPWSLFHEDFGTVTLNDRPCHTFLVKAAGARFVVDRVESPSKDFVISYPFRKPPIAIVGRKTYRYSVCFTPTQVGRIKVPIYVHIRRDQPVGKYKTYIVADTAYVNVVRGKESRPDPDQPIRTIERPAPPPKPKAPAPPPSGPKEPPVPVPNLDMATPVEGDPIVPDDHVIVFADPVPFEAPRLPLYEKPIFDPTTFRRILSPSARPLAKGSGFLASYDVAGLLAGYGVTDQLSVLAGGAWVPEGLGDFTAVSAGAKYALVDRETFDLSAGVQANLTTSPASDIVSAAPYVVADLGTRDYRVGATLGYSWRRHTPSDTTIAPFERRALLLGLGGDYRLARHWKISGEAFYITGSEIEPLALTLRWFNQRLAVDAGIVLDLVPEDGVTVAPLVSGVWVF